MAIITKNSTTKAFRVTRPEGMDGGDDDVYRRFDTAINDVQSLNGVEIDGQGPEGRRTIPVDQTAALDPDMPKWTSSFMYVTGLSLAYDQVPVDNGQSGHLPRALVKGLVVDGFGLRPVLATYSLPLSRKGTSYWQQATELAESIMDLPLNRPVECTFAGNVKFVRTNKGDVAHVNIAEIGGIMIPDYSNIGMAEPAHQGHPTFQRPPRRMVKGFWGYDSMSVRASETIERYIASVAQNGDSMPARVYVPDDTGSALAEDLA